MKYVNSRSRLARVWALALLISCAIVTPFTLSQERRPANWHEYAKQYALGDAAAAERQHLVNTSDADEAWPTDTVSSQWVDAIEAFLPLLQTQLAIAAANDAALSVTALQSDYEKFKSAYLLYSGSLQRMEQQLREAGLDDRVHRLRGVRAEDDVLFGPLFASLEQLLAHANGDDDNVDPEALTETLVSVVGSIQARQTIAAAPSLRASTLPFSPPDTSRIAPVTTPAIVPTYETNADSPSGPEDLSGDVQAPLSDAILLQAEALEYDPIQIFEFVQLQIDTDWYHGAMRGAEGTLAQRAGNAEDQASLLIALLRASSIPARYVHGVIQLDDATITGYLGVETMSAALAILQAAGIPHEGVIQGGSIRAVRLSHTWVSAKVPYANYRGAVVDRSGAIWLPLLPALKAYEYSNPENLLETAGVNASDVRSRFLAANQPVSVLEDIRQQIDATLGATPLDSKRRTASIAAQAAGLLPATLPVEVIAVTSEAAALPDNLVHKVRFVSYNGLTADSDVIMDGTFTLAEVASQRVTLSYQAGTRDDQLLIQASGGLLSTTAYLVSVRPQVKIAGLQKLVGTGVVVLGETHLNQVELIHPAGSIVLDKQVVSGGYEGVGIVAGGRVDNELEEDPADTELLAAKLLSQIGLNYVGRWREAELELADYANHRIIQPFADVAFAGNDIAPDLVLGRAERISWRGVSLDAVFRATAAVPVSGAATDTADYFRLSALIGSALEHEIFEEDFDVESISADKIVHLPPKAAH